MCKNKNNYGNLIEIYPQDGLILTQTALNHILEYGDQMSFTDFNGWFVKEPIYYQKRYSLCYQILLEVTGVVYIIVSNIKKTNKLVQLSERKINSIISKLQEIGIL